MSPAATANLGKFFADRRKRLRLTQRDVADDVGVSQNSVSNWERGRGFEPEHLDALLRVLHISAAEYAEQIHDDAIAMAIARVASAIEQVAAKL